MDKILLFASFLLMILGGVAMYVPWIILRNSHRLSGNELSRQYPQHRWMRRGFLMLYLSWIVLVSLVLVKILPSILATSLIAGLFASIGLYLGLFAVITGVGALPTRGPGTMFVVGEEAQSAGRLQVFWSVSVMVGITAIEVLHKLT